MILSAPIEFRIDPLAWEILPRIHIGPLAISPHGIGIAVGFFVGAQLMVRRARRWGGPPETDIWNMVFYCLLGSIAGARLGYVFGHLSQVTEGGSNPLGIVEVWKGGISLLGGITGAVLAALPYVVRHKMGFWRCADLAAPGLVLGIAIGRIGDLIIGDHLGKPTSFPLAWRCLGEAGGVPPQPASVYRAALERGNPPSLGCFALPLHETALYDFVSAWILFAVLIYLGRRAHRVGFLALVFVVWYGAMRVIEDFLRVDKRYFGLTGSQWWALLMVGVAAYLLARYRGAPPRFVRREASTPEQPTAQSSEIDEEALIPPQTDNAP